ncbi:hypothetical protein AAMO2058_000801400 [Amorphochlora amoebiformis]
MYIDPLGWIIGFSMLAICVTCIAPAVLSLTPLVGSLFFLDLMNVRPIVMTLLTYYRAMWYFSTSSGRYADCPVLTSNAEKCSRVHVASIAAIFHLWSTPHYRHDTFQSDLVLNLRNVAIPGTGVPLSYLTRSFLSTFIFLLVGYPLVSLIAAVASSGLVSADIAKKFHGHLLSPRDWFSLWRLNCCLAAMHYYKTRDVGYKLEDKWAFLTEAKKLKIPVTPWLDLGMIVIKHRNEEGGLGFHRFKNVSQGGEWIIQPALENTGSIAKLLPKDAPLSTFRVLTASTPGFQSTNKEEETKTKNPTIKTLTTVFRAGRSGAATDHTSILFDVDQCTGEVKTGNVNNHWYCLGPKAIFTTPWTQDVKYLKHPDSNLPVTGMIIGEIEEIRTLAENAHRTLAPGVPLVGWDVAVTDKGILLLEGNFSCNFFMGTVDYDWYYNFCDEYMKLLWLKSPPGPDRR